MIQPQISCTETQAYTTSITLFRNATLKTILPVKPILYRPLRLSSVATVIGWGRKPSGQRAIEVACSNHCSFSLLEDGFLRSVERQDNAISMVFDDKGIYYDSSCV